MQVALTDYVGGHLEFQTGQLGADPDAKIIRAKIKDLQLNQVGDRKLLFMTFDWSYILQEGGWKPFTMTEHIEDFANLGGISLAPHARDGTNRAIMVLKSGGIFAFHHPSGESVTTFEQRMTDDRRRTLESN